MFLFYLCIGFINKQHQVLDKTNYFIDSIDSMYNLAITYVLQKQGNKTNVENLIYVHPNIPEFRGESVFYITRFNDNPNKLYVIELIRNYGLLYNSFIKKKHFKIELFNRIEKVYFDCSDNLVIKFPTESMKMCINELKSKEVNGDINNEVLKGLM